MLTGPRMPMLLFDFHAALALMSKARAGTRTSSINDAPRQSGILQALAGGLQLDQAMLDAGRADGVAGTWRLSEKDILSGEIDVLAYASGYQKGRRSGSNNRG